MKELDVHINGKVYAQNEGFILNDVVCVVKLNLVREHGSLVINYLKNIHVPKHELECAPSKSKL
jgi:hypothetical protein